MKPIKMLLLSLSLLLCLTGCMQKTELKQTAIVQAIGIDVGENATYKVTLQTYDPKSSSDGIDTAENNAGLLVGEGDTLSQAMHNSTISTGETLFSGYNRLIIIGEELAKEGIADIFSYFDRDTDTRQNVEVAVAVGNASDIVSADITQGILAAQTLEKMMIQTDQNGYISSMQYYLLSKNMYLYEGCAVLPVLELLEKETEEGSIPLLQEVDATQSAVFTDYQWVETLTTDQTRGNVLLNDNLENTVVVAQSGEDLATVSIYDCDVALSVEIVGENIYLIADLTAKGSIDEVIMQGESLNEQAIEAFEEGCEAVFEQEMQECFGVMVQDSGADLLYLSERVRQADLSLWESYQQSQEDWLQSVQLQTNVDVQINRIGMQTNQP